jgi:hypothetical protein
MNAGELLLLLVVRLLLTGLPLAAAILLAAQQGVRRVPVLLAIGLAASGAVGLLGFWSYYADPVVGEAFSYLVLFGSILLVVWSLYGGHLDGALLRRAGTPLALWALGSAFLLFLGFAHGGADAPLATASTRFSHQLPADNVIPSFFADWFFGHGHHGMPPILWPSGAGPDSSQAIPAEWLASDRPPLQVGYVLSQRAFGWDARGLNYQVLGVVLQQLWIVGLWALLLAARVSRLTRGLAMVAVLLSDLAIVNGFFIWPKLLPAAMLLAVAALVMTPLWPELRRRLWAAALIAVLCALAMLGHGSSVFGIVPLAAVAAYRALPSWRWVATALAVGIATMAPWFAFQRYDSPPGNRLAKWTLAGVARIDDRSTSEAIVDAYGEAGVGGAFDNKVDNFETMGGGSEAFDTLRNAFRTGSLSEIVRALRVVLFFYLLPSMGLLLLAPVAMGVAWRRRRRNPAEWSFALACFAAFAIGAVVWGLLIFGGENDRTVVHIGSYLLPLLGMSGAVAGLRAAFPRLAVYLVGAAALLSLAVYAPALDPPPGSAYSLLAVAMAAASLLGFGAVALWNGGARLSPATRRSLPESDRQEAAQAPG